MGRTGRRHRRTILGHLAIAGFDDAAEAAFRRWLADELLPREPAPAALEAEIGAWFARGRVTRPGAYRLDRILRSARAAHDDAALQRVADRLDAGTRGRLDALLADDGEGTAFARLVADPGRVGLESLLAEIGKLEMLRSLALPPDLLRGLHPDQIKRFRRRAAVESAWELRRHPERIRLPLLAFYCVPREGEVVDGLVELLIQVTHRITVKAERRVVEELVEEAREVRGKAGILFKVAEAAVGRPDGVVREVIFPVAGEHTFEALVREARALGTPQSRRVHTAVRASYGSYYRRMMPRLLAALDFRSNNGTHRPLLDALDAIRRAEGEGRQYFRADEIAIEGVIRPKWRDIVVEDAPGGGQRVAGADRYRTPTRICRPTSPSVGRPAMRHPVSSCERVVGGGGAVQRRVIAGPIRPSAPEHAYPGPGEDANGVRMVAAAGLGALVDIGGPWGGVAGVVGEAGDRRAQAVIAGPAEDDAAALARGMCDRTGAGLRGELVGGGEALADVAEFGEDPCCTDAPGAREGHDDLSVRRVGDGLLDAAGQPGDLADQALEHGGKGANHLALGLGFGLVGQAGRCGAQPGKQLGRSAAAAIGVACEERLHPLLAEARGRLRRRVALHEGERDRRIDVGEDHGGAGPEAFQQAAQAVGQADALGDLNRAGFAGGSKP